MAFLSPLQFLFHHKRKGHRQAIWSHVKELRFICCPKQVSQQLKTTAVSLCMVTMKLGMILIQELAEV